MKKILLYCHGGSGNHGCEAIVRSTYKLLNQTSQFTLLSKEPAEDARYGLDDLVRVQPQTLPDVDTSMGSYLYRLAMKISPSQHRYWNRIYRSLDSLDDYDLAFSIGGDNYCYKNVPRELAYLNQRILKKGIRTILWGCSLEPDLIDESVLEDLHTFHRIVARERLTERYLKDRGFENVVYAPDPAFCLDRSDAPLPDGFIEQNTVGINVSPLIFNYEKTSGITLENYHTLIRYILDETDMSIALIPHVVWASSDDRTPLKLLYNAFPNSSRICMLPDSSCEVLKGYIARCRFLVTARTHASIAAYSQSVPTLVVGYSTKARGIAEDLFGSSEHYVLPVQKFQRKTSLLDEFFWLINHETETRKHYESILPRYKNLLYKMQQIDL